MKYNMRIKEISAVIFSILLLSMGFTANPEIFAMTVQEEKQEIINDLNNLKDDPEITKKSQKKIEKAIRNLEKSLDSKFWKDESTVNFKYGKNALRADQNAVKKLDMVLEDKKTTKTLKKKIIEINSSIVQIDKTLVSNSIISLSEIVLGEKSLKKIDKAEIVFEKGNELLDDDKYFKALKKYGKAWDQIRKVLKDPHFKKIRIVHLEGTADLDYDNDADIYLKILKPKKVGKPYQVEMKMTSECVKGDTYEDAGLKMGFSAPIKESTESFHEEFEMTNKWFKKYDLNKQIDLVVIDSVSTYNSYPETGDDFIQLNPDTMEGSFDYSSAPIAILDDQPGWEGKFQFKGEPGEYHMVVWVPITQADSGFICNFLGSFTIPSTIE